MWSIFQLHHQALLETIFQVVKIIEPNKAVQADFKLRSSCARAKPIMCEIWPQKHKINIIWAALHQLIDMTNPKCTYFPD